MLCGTPGVIWLSTSVVTKKISTAKLTRPSHPPTGRLSVASRLVFVLPRSQVVVQLFNFFGTSPLFGAHLARKEACFKQSGGTS